jgi:putative cell wall-binding protein
MHTNRGGKARTRAALALTVVLLLLASFGDASATSSFSFQRIAGENRYATAANVAIDSFGKAGGVVIATGEAFPDALSASFIAGYVNSPILLVERNRIPAETAAALTTLGVKEVVILGGSAAISDDVENQLDEKYDVVRLSGSDRFATAANVALAVNPGDIGELGGKRTAFLTYGYSFADALSVGPLAFAGRFPILLNGSAGLGTPAAVALDRLDITHVVIVGGVISDVARDQINAMGITTERVQGADRFATAVAVADFALTRLGFVPDHVNLVRGIDPADPALGFADGLTGSVHAGIEHAPLLLTHPTTLSDATLAWLEGKADQLATGDILGGESAVSASVEQAAVAAASRVTGYVVDVDLAARRYAYQLDGSTAVVDVLYTADDDFSIDGAAATVDAFSAALTVGDRIRMTTAGGARHQLTNVT